MITTQAEALSVDRAPGDQPPSVQTPLPAAAVLLLVATSASVMAQGAYYQAGQSLTAACLILALGCAHVARPLGRDDFRSVPILGCGALAAWAVTSAAVAGDIGSSRPIVGLLAGIAVVLLVCRRASGAHRTLLASGLVGMGAVVALTGWVGVAWRISPWALEDQGLWRAATTLTYSNAAAGLLVPLVLLALARLVTNRRSVPTTLAAMLLLVTIGASLSRAGILALVLGAMVLAALVGPKRLLPALVGPAVGALIALAGLAPSIPAGSPARPLVAVLALVVGMTVASLLALAATRVLSIVGVLAMALCVVVALFGSHSATVSTIRRPRLSVASSDRVHEAEAVVGVVVSHPLTGAGSGKANLTWTQPDGTRLTARYAHNEYLQTAAELGLVGLALLLTLMAAAGRSVWLGRRSGLPAEEWAGIVAGLVALALHSSFDFLWHLPAIPLVAALLLGIGGSSLVRETP